MHYMFNEIFHASTKTFEPCISFYQDEESDAHVTVTLSALIDVSRVMHTSARQNHLLDEFETLDGNSNRTVKFKFGFQTVQIDDNRHEPMTFPIKEFIEVLRHC